MESNKDLYQAVQEGNITEIELLLDRGTSINTITHPDKWSLLHLASFMNRTNVITFLVKRNADVNLVDRNGDTALHLAVSQGYIYATEILVENGSSLETRNIQDKTPLDVALCEQIHSSRECVYLDVDNQYKCDRRTEIVKYLQAKVELSLSVPTEIEQMKDKESVPLYLKLLESGSEKKRDIRLVVVGRKGAGKTSLIKRLFQESGIATKTNGIEIHQMRCKANLNDGIWTKINRKKEVLEINYRLLKPYKQSLKKHETETKKETAIRASESMNIVEEISNQSNIQTHNSSPTAKGEILKGRDDNEVPANQDLLPSQVVKLNANGVEQRKLTESAVNMVVERRTELPTELAHKDIRTMLQSEFNFEDNEEYASVFLWDFAGDEEFYHTHQTFLSQDAIYLVVTQLNEADTEGAQDMFRLWMDSIHCYCKMEEQQNKIDSCSETETSDDKLDPPIVIVGTFKDKVARGFGQKIHRNYHHDHIKNGAQEKDYQNLFKDKEDQIKNKCKQILTEHAEIVPRDALRHIREEYTVFISNTEDDNTVFHHLRTNILKIAMTMKTWNKEYPLKFIQLERLLKAKKPDPPIASFNEIAELANTIPKPLNTEELRLFLKYHHELRAVVYFKDIPDFVILDTQWLSDAFKCIVTAKEFQHVRGTKLQNRDEWNDFNLKGKLSHAVIEEIFSNHELFAKHKTHILKVMEKFDIIIPSKKNVDTDETCYYVPCMIKAEQKCDIHEMFGVTHEKRSTWLCFEFKFLPPHLMNHLVASLYRTYEFAEVVEEIALFKNMTVFDIQETGLHKLLLTTYSNLIQIQLWEFGEDGGSYTHVAEDVTDELSKIIDKRFRMTNVIFEKKLKCRAAKYDSIGGLTKLGDEQEAYYCKTCTMTHIFKKDWSSPFQKQYVPDVSEKHGKPTVSVSKKVYNVKFKSRTELSCSVIGHPKVDSITWIHMKDGQRREIRVNPRKYYGFATECLTILEAEDSDSGEYICTARNAHGEGESIPLVLRIITEKPMVCVKKTKYEVKFQSSVTLFCSISGYPKVHSILWKKQTGCDFTAIRDINPNTTKYHGSDTENLTINDVEDRDSGDYICIARNAYGKGQSSLITITVVGGLRDINKTIVDFEQKPSKDSLIRCKTEKRLGSAKNLKIGLEVAFGRIEILQKHYVYKHHGIITKLCNISETFEIVELTATATPSTFLSGISSKYITPKIAKNSVKFSEENMFFYDYGHLSFSSDIVKERAEMLVHIFDRSGLEYNLLEFNCEHFASYCTTGLAFSKQIPDRDINVKATTALDDILRAYIELKLRPDGGHLDNIAGGTRKKRCLVM